MRKNFLNGLMGIALTTVLLASCQSEENSQIVMPTARLQVGVSLDLTQTRGLVTAAKLPTNSEIGVFLKGTDGGKYDNIDYNNVKFTAADEADPQTWQGASTILLSATAGKAVAYYPYGTGVTNPEAISVTSDTQTDWLYSGWVSGLSNSSSKATFTMNHALSAVAVTLKRGSYTGTGSVSSISITSEGFGTAATLNATSGALSSVTGANTAITHTETFSISTEGVKKNIIVVPNESTGKGVTISVTIDGKTYTANGAMTTAYLPGNIYGFTLTLNSTGLSINKVQVTQWTEQNKGDLTIQ